MISIMLSKKRRAYVITMNMRSVEAENMNELVNKIVRCCDFLDRGTTIITDNIRTHRREEI